MKLLAGSMLGLVGLSTWLVAPNAGAAEGDTSDDVGDQPIAEKQQPASAEVLVNPIGLAFGFYNLEVGIGLGKSLSINPSFAYFSLKSGAIEGSAIGAGLGFQFFPAGQLYDGWFIYPNLNFASASATNGDLEASVTAYGLGVLGGYQWDWRPFTLRLGAGAVYYVASASGDDVEVGFQGLSPALDASLGVSF